MEEVTDEATGPSGAWGNLSARKNTQVRDVGGSKKALKAWEIVEAKIQESPNTPRPATPATLQRYNFYNHHCYKFTLL